MVIQLPNNTQRNVIISKDAVHEEEMMVSNFVKLTWNDATRYALPVGSYIVYGGVKYRLFDEYQPDASGECTFKYTPQFESPAMWLKHIPFLRIELDGTKRSEWSFSGYVSDLGAYLLNFLVTWGTDVDTEFGTDFNPSAFVSNHVQYSGGIGDMIINISFSAVDVWSALTQIAGQLDCEFHVDLAVHKLYIGTIATGTSETLTVGENVGVPSISRNKEAYCNRYVVHGGTRNLTQQGADGTNYQSTNRLTLPDYFEDSVIDLREDWPTGDNVPQQPEGWANIKASPTEPAITGELVMDDVYPQVKFYLYDLKQRLRKRLLENGTESSETYATWYTKLAIRNGDNFTTYKMQDSVIATVVSKGTNSYGQQYIVLNMAFGSGSQFTGGRLRPGFDEREYGLYRVEISDGTNKELAQVSPHGGGTMTKCIFQGSSLIYQNATPDAPSVPGTEITFIGGIDITKAPKNNIHSDRIAGVTLQCSFLPNYATGALDSPLTGRTFDIVTFNHSGTEHDNEDVDAQGQPSQGMAFDDETFRIEPVDENTLIIPQKSSQTLYPRANATANVVNNIVSLIGVKAPDTAIGVARTELLAAAIAAIKRKRLDNNTYTVKSYPQVFKSGNTSLSVGQAVTLINGTYTLATHVRKLVTRLDFPEIVEITVGNEKHKGPISTLKEQVNTVVYYGGGGVSAPAGGGSQSETPETTQMAERLVDNTPHRVWGQPYWQNGVPNDVSGSLSDVENILMDGFIEFGSNSRIYEDSDRKLKLRGYNGIEIEHNLFIGTDLAIKTAAVGENGTDLLAYKSGDWGGVTGAHWFVGAAGVNGFIRSYGELKRWKDANTQYRIWDESNLNPDNYLPLTGGSVEYLTIASSSSDFSLELSESGISFKYGGSEYGSISLAQDSADMVFDISSNATLGGAAIATESWVEQQGFLTSHQSLANYVTLDGTETITGQKTFGGIVNLQSDVYVTPTGTLYLQTYDSASRPVSSPAASQSWVSSQGFLTSAALSGYATTNQLDTGLAAKQDKITFVNTNGNTEAYFSYLHLPLTNSSGHAVLDLSGYLPLAGGTMTGSANMVSDLSADNYTTRSGRAIGMVATLNQHPAQNDNGYRGGVLFMFGREEQYDPNAQQAQSTQDKFEYVAINCLSEYKQDWWSGSYGLKIAADNVYWKNKPLALAEQLNNYVSLSSQQTISGAKTFSADVTHSGTSKAKFGSLSSIFENSNNELVLTGGNGIVLDDDTNIGNGYQLSFNNNNGISNYSNSYGDYLELWGANGVIIDDAAFIRENDELWKLATEDWVENCIGSAATLTIAQVTSSDQKVVTSGMTFTASNGTYLLKGNGNNNGKIVLRARFTASETCLVKVTLTASSEQNYDFGVVGLLDDDDLSSNSGSIGNRILAKASGNNNTVTKFVEVPAGDHYFEIGYVKDGSQSTYDDCATIKIEKVRTAFDCLPISGGTMTGDLAMSYGTYLRLNGTGGGTAGMLYASGNDLIMGGNNLKFYSDGNFTFNSAVITNGGSLCLGMSTPSETYKLDVTGNTRLNGLVGIGTAPVSGYAIDIDGVARATRWDTTSDERLKDVTEQLEPSAEDIAAAPIVTFRWKEGDGNENLGTLAQYWQTVFPQAVHEGMDGLLSMEYSTIALASAVTAARKAVALEQRVSELERLLATK